MNELGVAVLGTGFIGRVHVEAARRAGATVVGVLASSPERSEQAAAALRVPAAFRSAPELVAVPEVQVVHVCTPNQLHVEQVRLALDAGKHVVCEKPLATTVDDARALAAAARAAGVVAAVPFVYRYHPMAAEARDRVRVGSVGAVRLVHGSYLQDWLSERSDSNWRIDSAAGGASRAFADIGSHWCDLAQWVTGHQIVELSAFTRTFVAERPAAGAQSFATVQLASETRPVTTEDVAALLFRTDGGAMGTLLVSQVSPGRKNRLWFEVDGEAASVVFDQEDPEVLWVGRRAGAELLRRDPAALLPGAARLSVLPAGHPQGYADCFVAFFRDVYAAVHGGEPGPFPTFDDAVRTAEITESVLASAREGSWVAVPPA